MKKLKKIFIQNSWVRNCRWMPAAGLALWIFICGVAAKATSSRLFIDARYDFSSVSFNEPAQRALEAAKKEDGYQTFSFDTLRFDYRKQLNEDLFIRIRPRLDRPYGRNNSDNLSAAVELAYLEHRLNDSIQLTLGKFQSEIGGFEGNTSSTDLYHTSEIFSGHNLAGEPLIAGVSSIGVSSYRYPTGVKLDYQFGNSSVAILAGNRPTKTNEKDSPHFFRGVVFKNKLAESQQLRFSFHDEAAEERGWKNHFIALGWLGLFGAHEIVVDYLKTTVIRSSSRYLEGINLQWAASWSSYWRSVLKYTRAGNSETESPFFQAHGDQSNGFSAAAEYRPFESSAFRYHFGGRYQDLKKNAGSNEDIWTLTEVFVGFRLNWDFLKD